MSAYTVLVVEDNPITRKMMRVALESEGLRVLEAPDARTALDLAARGAPDLILQDIILPDMDGVELVQQLRALPGINQVPILAVTGFASKFEEGRVAAAGFNDVLIKPVEPSRLVQEIRAFLPGVEPAMTGAGAGHRVLVADDDAIQRKLLVLHLESLGFWVEAAADGAEALERARAARPDAILSDVFMPRLDGFALCHAIRLDPRLADVPVVLCSSFYLEEADRGLGREVGANAWVNRTPDLRNVVEALVASLSAPAPPPAVTPADHVTALHSQRLLHQLEQQAAMNANLRQRCALLGAELSVLSGISEVLVRAPDVEGILAEVLYRCLDAGGLSRGALYLVEPDGRLLLRAQIGYQDLPPGEAEGFFGHPELLEQIAREGSTVVIPSGAVPEATAREFLRRSRGTHALIAPLLSSGQVLGALLMGSRSQKLEEEDWLFFARTVAAQLGQAVALGRAFSQVVASEQRYRGLFESIGEGMLIAGEDGLVIDANPAALDLTGHAPEELRGLQVADLLPPAPERDGGSEGDYHPNDRVLLAKDGRRKLVEVTFHRIPPGLHLYALRDVTAQRRAEEVLRQTEKLATMGELLAGVAHELNNPLSIVLGQTTMLRQAVAGDALIGRTDKIMEAADRCTRIVRNFLTLARQRPPERRRVLLNQVVREAVELLGYHLRANGVQVVFDLAQDIPTISADPHQLNQVVVNLVTNAQHAMRGTPPPRRLTLSSRFNPVAGHISLEVADTGPGIPPEVQARIFEPFFTTKPQGEGTGLGLSLCQGIVEGHGGNIRVQGGPGKGTTFVIEIPATAPPPADAEAPAAEALPPIRGKRILVVDDEPVIAELLTDLLTLDEHTVDTAPNGAVALQKLSARAYDLILSDIKMPELDGVTLYRLVERHHPELCRRFIFITGDLLTRDTREFLERTGVPNLCKPLILQDVHAAVQRTLRAAEAVRPAPPPPAGSH